MTVWTVIDEPHEMLLDRGGDDYIEWHCPTCQRRIRFHANPKRMEILVRGNEAAVHAGGQGAVVADVRVER